MCRPYTTTTEVRAYALWQAVGHVVTEKIKGCMIECGSGKGGSAMLMVLAAQHFGWSGDLILFDRFVGMAGPSEQALDNKDDFPKKRRSSKAHTSANNKVQAGAWIDEVRRNIGQSSFEDVRVVFIQGCIVETLPVSKTGQIALMRFATDDHASITAAIEILYPKLSSGGILLIDDYDNNTGVQKAVGEYFEQMALGSAPFLAPIDFTGRIAVKPAYTKRKVRDYLPEGFADLRLLEAFPTLLQGDTSQVKWPWLRRNSPHIWRTDTRSQRPQIGVLSYEEAAILYNFGRSMAGQRGLEIGCHLAWSTAHLVATGMDMDVIDPALGDAQHEQQVRESITAATGADGLARSHLHPGFSPGLIDLARVRRPEPWSFAFIDGFHDQGAPLRDAKAIVPHMAHDAMIFFHDLICPDVHEGVTYMEERGWNIRLLNTSQVMAVAWRGNVVMPKYTSDPLMPDAPGDHLAARRKRGFFG